MTQTNDLVKEIGEVERRISEGESLLRQSGNERVWEWIFFGVGILMIFFLDSALLTILGAVVIAASIWRMVKTEEYTIDIEDGLSEYRGRRAEMYARLLLKE